MNKKFNANDKIELGLHKHVAEYYHLKYRFVPKKVQVRILWFYIFITLRDHWHVLLLYKSTCMPEVNPDDEALWRHVQIDVTNNHDVQYYRNLKRDVHTYAELDRTYSITAREEQYLEDLNHFKSAKRLAKYK